MHAVERLGMAYVCDVAGVWGAGECGFDMAEDFWLDASDELDFCDVGVYSAAIDKPCYRLCELGVVSCGSEAADVEDGKFSRVPTAYSRGGGGEAVGYNGELAGGGGGKQFYEAGAYAGGGGALLNYPLFELAVDIF